MCWLLIQPYVKEIISKKSQIALYEMVMEREALFQQLPLSDQQLFLEGHSVAKKSGSPSLVKELGRLLFVDTPPFALAWLFFSLAICLLYLFHIEGAAHAAWLLPLIVLGYAYFLYIPTVEKRVSLFPTEAHVLSSYVSSEEQTKLGQRGSLLLGWHRYLVNEWAHESYSSDPDVFKAQLDKGLFAFNIARIKWILEGKGDEIVLAGFTASPSLLRVGCYFIWNLIFAWMINRRSGVAVSVLNGST